MNRWSVLLFWILICVIIGFAFDHFSGGSFWVGAGIGSFAMIVNAIIIQWEDRQPGGWDEE